MQRAVNAFIMTGQIHVLISNAGTAQHVIPSILCEITVVSSLLYRVPMILVCCYFVSYVPIISNDLP